MSDSAPASGSEKAVPSRTLERQAEQYRDRWSLLNADAGIVEVSDRLAPEQLRAYSIFSSYDDKFLERLSPDVAVVRWQAGAVLFEEGSYIDLAFCVVEGEVEVALEGLGGARDMPIFDPKRTVADVPMDAGPDAPPVTASGRSSAGGGRPITEITFLASMDFDLSRGESLRLGPGELFGEIGALSGWPQSATARTLRPCTLIQIRMPALRAMKRKSKDLKERLDRRYRDRELTAQLRRTPLLRSCHGMFLEALKQKVELVSLEPDEVLVQRGETVDALYIVRSGFIKLLQPFGKGEIVATYLSKGMTLGELELLAERSRPWQSTAVSVEYAELLKIPRDTFQALLSTYPQVEEALWRTTAQRLKDQGQTLHDPRRSEFTSTALDMGLVQGASMLVIDLEQCTRCDDCVRACAATHQGRPRFVREGDKIENLLVARSCYHCQDPVCLVGCPTGAIQRAGVGVVVAIEESICIGCNTCARNCPYDAIVMHETGVDWPEDMVPVGLRGKPQIIASKCDLCYDTGHEPACVSSCPQGCAHRVGSVAEIAELLGRGGRQ